MIDKLIEKLKKNKEDVLIEKIMNNQSLSEKELLFILSILEELSESKTILEYIHQYEGIFPKLYYELMKFKINAYMDLKQYDEAKRNILNELEVPYIPQDFEKFLKDCLKEINYYLNEDKFLLKVKDLDNLDQMTSEQILMSLSQLKNFNLLPYLDKVQTLLIRQDIPNITKSLLLATLSDLKIDYEFALCKDGIHFLYNPIHAKDLRSYASFIYLHQILEERVSKKMDINDFALTKQIGEMYLLSIYPKDLNELDVWNLYYALFKVMQDIKKENFIFSDEVEFYYQKNQHEVDNYIQKIHDLLKNF